MPDFGRRTADNACSPGSFGRQECGGGDPCLCRRRGGGAVCRRPLPDVWHVCRPEGTEGGKNFGEPHGIGGYREIDFLVSGQNAYSSFKFESGVHRVQRVPETESQGRIQTSTVSVAVLPEADEVEVHLDPADISFESCKSSGAGGQHINKTESAVRLTHKPTGIVVECDEERSQFKNKEKALKLLRARLFDIKQREQDDAISGKRREQVGSGDRSEKIRTYNYPQSRITDHRIGLTLYSLSDQLNGNLDPIISILAAEDAAKRLTEQP